MAARMAFMPPSLRMDSVEKLVCAPVPVQHHGSILFGCLFWVLRSMVQCFLSFSV